MYSDFKNLFRNENGGALYKYRGLYAGSAPAPEAKSLPLPPKSWMSGNSSASTQASPKKEKKRWSRKDKKNNHISNATRSLSFKYYQSELEKYFLFLNLLIASKSQPIKVKKILQKPKATYQVDQTPPEIVQQFFQDLCLVK